MTPRKCKYSPVTKHGKGVHKKLLKCVHKRRATITGKDIRSVDSWKKYSDMIKQ